MKYITLQDIKSKGAKAITQDETSFLVVNSRPMAAIVPFEEYEAMVEALEELEDIRLIEERKNEKGIPYDEFFKQLDDDEV